MNILRHHFVSTIFRSPDEPAAPEPEVIEPVAETVEEPVAEVQPEPEPQPEPVAAEVKPEPHGNQGKTPWFNRVIAEVREDKRQALTRAEAAEQRAADLQAIIERMQGGEAPDPAAARKPTASAAPPKDFDAAVKAEAARQRLYDDTVAVRSAGEAEFKDFGDSLQILNFVGATNDDFVADLLAVDKAGAHKILDKLAKDPEKAASLVGMDSRRRIAELTRMADAPKTEVKPVAEPVKPTNAISRAPAPKPTIVSHGSGAEVDPTTPDGNDKMSDAEFERWYKNKYQKRA